MAKRRAAKAAEKCDTASSYDDATVQALMEEAARYLDYPYVWGGSSQSTSFDCSGFLSAGYLQTAVSITCHEPQHRAFITSVRLCRRQMQRRGILSFYRYIQFGRTSQPCGDLLRKQGHDSLRRSNQLRFNQFVLLAEPFLCVWKIIRKLK